MYVTHSVSENLRILDTAQAPVPSEAALARVDEHWAHLAAANPRLFNGRIFSLDRMEGETALGFLAPYAWYVAQLEEPALARELKVRSLALSGMVTVNGHLLFGLRKPDLAVEAGLWETAPTGTLSDSPREPDGSLSWRGAFLEEMREELGLAVPPSLPRPFALVENTDTGIWEMGLALDLAMDHRDALAAWAACPDPEHTELAAVPLADVPRFLKVRGKNMVGATAHLVAASGLVA